MAKVSIFGFAGTGKTTAGKLLAEKLGYRYMSTGHMFRDKAIALWMTLPELEEKSKTDEKFDKELDHDTEVFGKANNNFVIESRLAWYFIPDSYKVAFTCDLDTRIKRIMIREDKEVEQVKKETLAREDAIRERYAKYYNITDVANPKNFDLSIDTTSISPEEIVQIIMTNLKEKKII